LSLTANLGLLGFFKYGQFLLDNFVVAAASIGIQYAPPGWNITLPVGISFYSFQTLSYTIDVYRGRIRPWHSFLDFALFVTFFPQLVTGPIVRAADSLPQLSQERRATSEQFGWGLTLFAIGLFQKAALADSCMAPVVDLVYGNPASAGFLDAWAGTLAFSAQVFFDFSGYSTCPIGIALTMGFAL
jgi:alginate O-acetyltransferase complex protein AlgI